jgi:hypothetical protein
MENIQTAVQHAYDAKPSEFKSSVLDALSDKLQNHLNIRRMELAGSIFKDNVEEISADEEEFQLSSEGNVDEDI